MPENSGAHAPSRPSGLPGRAYLAPRPDEPRRFRLALAAAATDVRPLVGATLAGRVADLLWQRYALLSVGRVPGVPLDAFGDDPASGGKGPVALSDALAVAAGVVALTVADSASDRAAVLVEVAAPGERYGFAVGGVSGMVAEVFPFVRFDEGVWRVATAGRYAQVHVARHLAQRVYEAAPDTSVLRVATGSKRRFAGRCARRMALRFPVREDRVMYHNVLVAAALWNVLLLAETLEGADLA